MQKKQNDNKKTDIKEMLLQGFLHINNRMRALHEGKASRKRNLIVLCELLFLPRKIDQWFAFQGGLLWHVKI